MFKISATAHVTLLKATAGPAARGADVLAAGRRVLFRPLRALLRSGLGGRVLPPLPPLLLVGPGPDVSPSVSVLTSRDATAPWRVSGPLTGLDTFSFSAHPSSPQTGADWFVAVFPSNSTSAVFL